VATLENPDHEALIVGAGFGGIAAAIARAEMWLENRFFPLSNYRYSSQPLRPAFEEAINDRDRSPAHTSAQGS
jgi:hypothetical protein